MAGSINIPSRLGSRGSGQFFQVPGIPILPDPPPPTPAALCPVGHCWFHLLSDNNYLHLRLPFCGRVETTLQTAWVCKCRFSTPAFSFTSAELGMDPGSPALCQHSVIEPCSCLPALFFSFSILPNLGAQNDLRGQGRRPYLLGVIKNGD